MAVPSLFPMLLKAQVGGVGGVVTVLPDGVELTAAVLEIAFNDTARIVNLPASLGVALLPAGLSASLVGGIDITLGDSGFNVEICKT